MEENGRKWKEMEGKWKEMEGNRIILEGLESISQENIQIFVIHPQKKCYSK
mgnify:CR=1 FL=1